MKRYVKKRVAFGKRFRRGFALTLLTGIVGAGAGIAFWHGTSYAADSNPVVTRGVIDTIDQLPEGKGSGFDLGTQENPGRRHVPQSGQCDHHRQVRGG